MWSEGCTDSQLLLWICKFEQRKLIILTKARPQTVQGLEKATKPNTAQNFLGL